MSDSAKDPRPEQEPVNSPSAQEQPAAQPAPPSATALHESLKRLVSVKSHHESFAAEAVRLLAKAAGAEAAALLVSDPRASRVRLLAAIGADKDVFRDLVEQRGLWISLRCLNERQINVITAAQSNPFVPQSLVSAINPRGLSIAALPVYHLDVPVGVVILFSSNPNTFTDSVLYTVSKALRACARLLGEAWGPSRGHRRNLRSLTPSVAPASTPDAEPEPEQPTGPIEIHQLLQRERHRVTQLEGELRGLRAAGDRLPSLQAEVERLNRQAAEARAAAEAARAQAAQLEVARVEAENRARAAAATLEALLEARHDQQEKIEEALSAARERTGAVAEIDSRMREFLERVGQVDHLSAALRASEAARERFERDVHHLEQRVEQLEAERREVESALLERTEALQTARSEVEGLAGRLAELEAQLGELREQQAAATSLADRARELEEDRASLAQQLETARAALTEREAREAATTSAWQQQVSDLETERDRLRVDAVELREELNSLIARQNAAGEENAKGQARLEEQQGIVSRLEAERDRLQARISELEGALAVARDTAQAARSGRWSPVAPNPLLDRELLEIFGAEAREHLESCEQLFLMLERQSNDRELQDALLRRFHTLKGAAAAVGLDTVVSQIHDGETVLELIEGGKHRADGVTIDFFLRLTESLAGLIVLALGGPPEGRRIISDMRAELARLGVQPSTPPPILTPPPPLRPVATRNRASDTDAAMLHVQAARLETLLEAVADLDATRIRVKEQLSSLSAFRDHIIGWRTRLADERVKSEQPDASTTATARHDLTVETNDLAAELARIIDTIDHRDRAFSTITGDLYRQIDQLRRVSLDTIFRRLPRAVRDAARQTGKQVALKMEGNDILLEREVTEALFSPLLHLVRNALVHGIELPSVRRAAGKNPQGTIRITAAARQQDELSAIPTGDMKGTPAAPTPACIELTVEDDGAGLDLEKILTRAKERRLVKNKARLTLEEAVALIFKPGFTTAEGADDLAGRGVGMDAIAHRINVLGGNIRVDSERGRGTTVQLLIPVDKPR